jgi:hypothetical protein
MQKEMLPRTRMQSMSNVRGNSRNTSHPHTVVRKKKILWKNIKEDNSQPLRDLTK